ncbi:hypothetical protein ACTWQF_28085 [Streptomyces sp. 8N114]|uniref:hypothetical protein n=1 Tax=Streptomyces sp. 8N114 TaxID=3457419 RepID=UPI003FD0112B
MPNRLKRTLAAAALVVAPLTMTLGATQAVAAAPSSISGEEPKKEGSKKPHKEKPDSAAKEAYERLHEPKEKSEKAELAREQKHHGR